MADGTGRNCDDSLPNVEQKDSTLESRHLHLAERIAAYL